MEDNLVCSESEGVERLSPSLDGGYQTPLARKLHLLFAYSPRFTIGEASRGTVTLFSTSPHLLLHLPHLGTHSPLHPCSDSTYSTEILIRSRKQVDPPSEMTLYRSSLFPFSPPHVQKTTIGKPACCSYPWNLSVRVKPALTGFGVEHTECSRLGGCPLAAAEI